LYIEVLVSKMYHLLIYELSEEKIEWTHSFVIRRQIGLSKRSAREGVEEQTVFGEDANLGFGETTTLFVEEELWIT
jgi:hypothetical protein